MATTSGDEPRQRRTASIEPDDAQVGYHHSYSLIRSGYKKDRIDKVGHQEQRREIHPADEIKHDNSRRAEICRKDEAYGADHNTN